MIDHGVENGEIGFPGHAETARRAKRDKAVHQELTTGSDPAIRHEGLSRPAGQPASTLATAAAKGT